MTRSVLSLVSHDYSPRVHRVERWTDRSSPRPKHGSLRTHLNLSFLADIGDSDSLLVAVTCTFIIVMILLWRNKCDIGEQNRHRRHA